MKKELFITAIIVMLATSMNARPSTAYRMRTGNSNGFTMNAWYGGKNKHKCGLHKTIIRTKSKLLKY